VFFGVSALLFAGSAAVTIGWCASMSAMGEMPMPGGWTMSMAWMRMPDRRGPALGRRSSAFPLGVALAANEMQQPALARAVPIAVGAVVLIAGSLQFTAWKARHLARYREAHRPVCASREPSGPSPSGQGCS